MMRIDTGDKGQRWEIQYFPAVVGNQKVFGWAGTYDAALDMLDAICLWPAASGGFIFDREQGIITLKRMRSNHGHSRNKQVYISERGTQS